MGGGEIQIGNRKIDSSVQVSKQKCIILNVDDDTISKRVAMSCGHAITPDGLAEFVDAEIKKKKTKIICPMQNCDSEWKVSEIAKRGLTTKEREHLETGLTKIHSIKKVLLRNVYDAVLTFKKVVKEQD